LQLYIDFDAILRNHSRKFGMILHLSFDIARKFEFGYDVSINHNNLIMLRSLRRKTLKIEKFEANCFSKFCKQFDLIIKKIRVYFERFCSKILKTKIWGNARERLLQSIKKVTFRKSSLAPKLLRMRFMTFWILFSTNVWTPFFILLDWLW